MSNYTYNGNGSAAVLETPFSDLLPSSELGETAFTDFQQQFESPFMRTYDSGSSSVASELAEEYVQFLAELNDTEFSTALYEVASEIEDTYTSRISDEVNMGEEYLPFVTRQSSDYINTLAQKSEEMIDKVTAHFSGNAMGDYTEGEVDRYFSEANFEVGDFTPAQEQLFGGLINKAKSIVKKGVELAKKGVAAVSKLLPINIILGKLKALVRPLLDKVLRFAIGKLPKNLQPHAQTLAKKFLNMEVVESESDIISASGEVDAIQNELDAGISSLVFEADGSVESLVADYESSIESLTRETHSQLGGRDMVPLEVARRRLIRDLSELPPGQDATPAIEQFLPVAVMALKPLIRMGISIIGRPKVVNFIAGLLAKLVGSFIPQTVAKPLATSIVDIGMKTIGFETADLNKADLAYEAIANTVEDTVQRLSVVNESDLNDSEALTTQVLDAFESAAADNFPAQYIKEELRRSTKPGVWVLKPRKGPRHLYKKFTHAFTVTIDPQTAQRVTTFRNLPLANFLRDKLGVDVTKPVQAKVHLYEAINGTKLSAIPKWENLPSFNKTQPYAWVQLHPLTQDAAALLLKEPTLGKDVDPRTMSRIHRTTVGQRFYFLEINGARLKIPAVQKRKYNAAKPARSADVQATLNFVKSSISLNYYLSEEDARSLVERISRQDVIGAAMAVKGSIEKVLNTMLQKGASSKVKIIHESIPELYLENMPDEESESVFGSLAKRIGGIVMGGGRGIIKNILEKITSKISGTAYDTVLKFLKTRGAEFKNAQAAPEDGVTIKIAWANVTGMSGIRTVIQTVRGNLPLGNLGDLAIPALSAPEIKIVAGKNFE